MDFIINPPLVVAEAGERKLFLEKERFFRELTVKEKAVLKILSQPYIGPIICTLKLTEDK